MSDGLAGEMARLASELAEQPTVEATLDSICSQVLGELGADACGIFLLRARRVEVAAVSGLDAAEAERAQLETGEGPCLETVWTSESVLVPDLRSDGRWPRWAARMVES